MSTSISISMSIRNSNNYEIQLRKELAKEHNFRYVGMPTSKGTVRVLDGQGEWKLVDFNGRPLTKDVVYLAAFSEARANIQETLDVYHQYFIDETGNKINSTSLKVCTDSYFSEGFAPVKDKTNKIGYINKEGQLAIGCLFQQVTEFSDSVAWVRYPLPSPMGSLFYLIDKTGNQKIPYPFRAINPFIDGVAGVELFEHYFDPKMRPKKLNPNYVLIDKKGNHLSDRFFYIEEFHDDLAVACFDGTTQIFIDKRGKQVTKKSYETLGFLYEGICWAILDNKTFYMDKEENQISPFCDQASNFSEGLGCVRNKGQYFFIDKNGRQVFSQTFDKAESFDEGVAQVQKDGKVFYIDHSGEPIFI